MPHAIVPEAEPRDGQAGGAEAAGQHGGDPIARPLATVGAMRLAISCGYAGMGLGTDTLDLVQEAERLGYAQAWVAEAYGSDAPTVLAWLAGQTTTIGLGAGVMQIPARTPAMTAMTAATLDTLSAAGGSTWASGCPGPQVSEGWHGVRFAAPLAPHPRVRRDRADGAAPRDRWRMPGEHFTLPLPDGPGKALRLTIRPPRADLPIYLAAVGPRNLRLAGEVADGWLGIFFSPEHSADQLAAVRAGREAVGAGTAGRPDGRLRRRSRRCPSSSPTTSRRPGPPWPTTRRSTSAGWAAVSRTSTTRSPGGWASRRPPRPSRTSTSTAGRATPRRPCPSS